MLAHPPHSRISFLGRLSISEDGLFSRYLSEMEWQALSPDRRAGKIYGYLYLH